MIPTLITAGCSFTKDHYHLTWADFLAQHLDRKLINVAARGAGPEFVAKRLIMALHDAPEDTVVAIMLPSSDRFDCYVDQQHVLKEKFIDIASWQDGKNPYLVTLDGELSTERGYSLSGSQIRGFKKNWYMYYYNPTQANINFWFNVIAIQDHLKLRNIPYFFVMANDLSNTVGAPENDNAEIEYNRMTELVDFDRFIFYNKNQGFLSFASDRGYDAVRTHPVEPAHLAYVEQIIIPALEKKKLFE